MEKLRVMLVDDEILAIEDVKAMVDWDAHGYHVVAVSTSSAEALELYKKHRPQIVITDINMPVMNGLDLSREMMKRAAGDPLKIILLTAYSDFHYAKSGFEIGVSNYILKHELSEERLLAELERLKGQLKENQKAHRILAKEQLHLLMTGELSIEEYEAAKYGKYHRKSFLMLGLRVDKPWGKGPASEIHLGLDPELEEIHIYEVAERELVVLAVTSTLNSQRRAAELMSELVPRLREELSYRYEVKAKILTCGGIILPEELEKNYERLREGMKSLIFMGAEKTACIGDLYFSKEIEEGWITDKKKELERFYQTGETEMIRRVLDELFEKTVTPKWNIELLNRICQELLYILRETGTDIRKLNMDSVKELKESFLRRFEEGLQLRAETDNRAYSKKINKIIQYIHRHYGEFITIEDVAESTNISPVYLCQIFKKETGVTFLEYLTDYRIKMAKELIKSGDYKVYEIAQMVGYRTSQYFSQVFKKATGINPMDYKE